MKTKIITILLLLSLFLAAGSWSDQYRNSSLSYYHSSRLLAALNPNLLISNLEKQIEILKKILDLTLSLNALRTEGGAPEPSVEAVSTTTLISGVKEASSSIKKIKGKIETLYPARTVGSSAVRVLTEFRITADSKVALKKIKFKNNGTLLDPYLADFTLQDNSSRILARADKIENGIVEFNFVLDDGKLNKGLVVSDETYSVSAFLLTLSRGLTNLTVRLDIEDENSLEVVDFNNPAAPLKLDRVDFPILGAQITTF